MFTIFAVFWCIGVWWTWIQEIIQVYRNNEDRHVKTIAWIILPLAPISVIGAWVIIAGDYIVDRFRKGKR